jgi:hypothetical protein
MNSSFIRLALIAALTPWLASQPAQAGADPAALAFHEIVMSIADHAADVNRAVGKGWGELVNTSLDEAAMTRLSEISHALFHQANLTQLSSAQSSVLQSQPEVRTILSSMGRLKMYLGRPGGDPGWVRNIVASDAHSDLFHLMRNFSNVIARRSGVPRLLTATEAAEAASVVGKAGGVLGRASGIVSVAMLTVGLARVARAQDRPAEAKAVAGEMVAVPGENAVFQKIALPVYVTLYNTRKSSESAALMIDEKGEIRTTRIAVLPAVVAR